MYGFYYRILILRLFTSAWDVKELGLNLQCQQDLRSISKLQIKLITKRLRSVVYYFPIRFMSSTELKRAPANDDKLQIGLRRRIPLITTIS